MGRVSSLRANYQTYEETYETRYASGWRKSLRWLPLLCDCNAPIMPSGESYYTISRNARAESTDARTRIYSRELTTSLWRREIIVGEVSAVRAS